LIDFKNAEKYFGNSGNQTQGSSELYATPPRFGVLLEPHLGHLTNLSLPNNGGKVKSKLALKIEPSTSSF